MSREIIINKIDYCRENQQNFNVIERFINSSYIAIANALTKEEVDSMTEDKLNKLYKFTVESINANFQHQANF